MKTKLLLLYIAGLLAVCPMGGNLMAQTATQPDVLKNDTVSHKLIHRLGLDVRPSYVTPTNDFFDGDNMHQQRIRQALSVHLKYAFQFDKNSSLGRLYPHAYQGIGVSYNTFFCPSELGNPIAVYAFQGSRIAQLSPRLSFIMNGISVLLSGGRNMIGHIIRRMRLSGLKSMLTSIWAFS